VAVSMKKSLLSISLRSDPIRAYVKLPKPSRLLLGGMNRWIDVVTVAAAFNQCPGDSAPRRSRKGPSCCSTPSSFCCSFLWRFSFTSCFRTEYGVRKYSLLLLSYLFYMAWRVEYVVLILISTIVDYTAAQGMPATRNQHKRKVWLAARRTLLLE
jgi:hypothetical protein